MVLIFYFKCTLKCRLLFVSILDQSDVLSSGNGLKATKIRKCYNNNIFDRVQNIWRKCEKERRQDLYSQTFLEDVLYRNFQDFPNLKVTQSVIGETVQFSQS